ncbi:MAG: M20/M25/M40 family metallo-hydrolase [Gemmatimonadales bacterium]
MKRLLLAAALLLPVPALAQGPAVDTSGAGALIDQAMNHSAVMANLQHLADAIGPRLTGSPGMRKANEWTAARFREYGLKSWLEDWDFGVTWERGPIMVRLVAPYTQQVPAWSWAWTAGTGGRALSGPIVRLNITDPDSLARYKDQIRGAWIMPRDPANIWNPDGPPMSAADSAEMREAFAARRRAFQAQNQERDSAEIARRRQFSIDLPYLLKQAGALGTLADGSKEFDLATMSGSPNRVSPLPNIVVGHEDYLTFSRMIEAGLNPRLEASVQNTIGTTPVKQANTVAEIRGSELPGQVVILGAHLDSWDVSQGVTDNGTGSMVVLEAARAIARSGIKPKRTIRFILFSGEEQGLLGSRAYAAAHAAEADSIQAVLVLDNGTGMILGQALQGRDQDEQLWKDLLAPVNSLGATRVRQGNKGGTDHLSFIPYGVPGWNFDQESRGYNHTHHSQVDSYNHAVPGDLRQASAVMAVTAVELANLPVLLPRGEKRDVAPVEPARPSPGLARK